MQRVKTPEDSEIVPARDHLVGAPAARPQCCIIAAPSTVKLSPHSENPVGGAHTRFEPRKAMPIQSNRRTTRTLTFVGGILLALARPALGADVYITQSTSNLDSGASCANAHSASWFNSNATGGNVYHLCGTFTGAANSTMFTIPNSGTSGSPLYVLFEPNAVLTSPQWSSSGAIIINGKNYVTIDGGTNGLITNTANGMVNQVYLAYHQTSTGVNLGSCHDVEIKNLTISHIYQNDGTNPANVDQDGWFTSDINVWSSQTSNILIHNNTVSGAAVGIAYGYSGYVNDNVHIYNNNISDMSWGIQFVDGSGTTSTATNSSIYGNVITNWANWMCPTASSFCNAGAPDPYHKDGIFLWKPLGNTVPTIIDIYDNYIYGNMSGGSTGGVTCSYGGGTGGGGAINNLICRVYNNLIALSPAGTGIGFGGALGPGQMAYNNTLIGSANNYGITFYYDHQNGNGYSSGTVENNIFEGWGYAIGALGGSNASFSLMLTASDHNLYYNINGGPTSKMFDSTDYCTWATWQTAGRDLNGAYADPKVTSDYTLQSGSPAIGLGTDLSGLAITALDSDKAGVARPGSGAWDAGAYQFAGSKPNPPTNLTAIPH